MKKICFVCLGNICRSPMAEFIMKDLLDKNNLSNSFSVSSKATSSEEIGNDIYPPVKEVLDFYNIPYTRRMATKLDKSDYEEYDYIIGMDDSNITNILRIIGEDRENKVSKLTDEDILDPWYTRDFNTAYIDIKNGCQLLLERIKKDVDY